MMSDGGKSRRDFLKSVGLGAVALGASGAGQRVAAQGGQRTPGGAQVGQPNILIFVADDLGWADVGYHGSQINTPNIDRLLAEGTDLDQHYVCPMCTPTRAALLSGRYPSRFGDRARAPSNERVYPWGTATLASALGSVGYDSGLSGKWHLGSLPEWGPNHFGFNRSYGSLAGGVGCYDHRYKKGPYTYTWHRDDELVDEEGHVTDLIGQEALGWIREKKQPWFYYVPFTAVHIPVEAPQEYIDLYAGQTYYDDPVKDEAFKRYAAYATQMDDWMGKMVEALEATGQRDNTIILFFSDNGAPRSWKPQGLYPGTYPASPVLGSNAPLRGLKGQTYEGGIRTPAFINWRGTLRPGKVTAPLHAIDWMPTLTKLVGYRPDRDLQWDGTDMWPILTGAEEAPAPRTLYWPFVGERWAIRYGDWKLLSRGEDQVPELYNLADDPYEKQDLAAEAPDKVAKLQQRLAEVQELDSAERPADEAG
jgi:arylsulfatase A-like enzyme